MAYPFVASYHDYGSRGAVISPLTIVVHMAEGGGTVGFLSRKNPNGVSVHYVVERSGRVVQMLQESHVNGSINPRDIRTTDDPAYNFRGEWITYGATAAKQALGQWWQDPNRATIGIEVEGFAAEGPNSDQTAALARLVADIRTREKGAPLLGHRDFADYKACPGRRIDWALMGGHGTHEQEDEPVLDFHPMTGGDGVVTIKAGRGLVNVITGKAIVTDDPQKLSYCRVHLAEPLGDTPGRQDGYLVRHSNQAHIALDDVVETFTPATTAAPKPITYELSINGQTVASGNVTEA